MNRITALLFSLLILFSLDHVQAVDSGDSAIEIKSHSADAATDHAAEKSDTEASFIRFNFRNAEWPPVLELFAERAGLTLDLTDTPPGNFNYIDDNRHTIPQALDVVNGYLLPRGYVTLRRNQFLVVLKTDNPILPNLIPTVPAETLKDYGNNELLRIVVPVVGMNSEDVAGQLESILGPHGKASPLNASQSIVLQGFGKSLRETVLLLEAAAVTPTEDELIFRSFALKRIPATDAERQIQNLFGLASGSNPYQASMARRAEYESRRFSRGRDDDKNPRPTPVPLMQNIAINMKVSALRHTNSLLVTATPAAIKLVENILESIDVAPPGGEAALFADSTPVLRVYKVTAADEDDVAETVNAVISGVVINEDGRHNSIHVLATPAEHREVEELIRIIDGESIGAGVEVISLTQTDPTVMAEMLESLFENEDRDDRPAITPDLRNATLVVRATSRQMGEIKKTLAAFGENAGSTQSATTSGGSRFRKLTLQSERDAERVARVVEELLHDDRSFQNQIRVVVPSRGTTTRAPQDAEGPKRTRINAEPDDRYAPDDRVSEYRERDASLVGASLQSTALSVAREADDDASRGGFRLAQERRADLSAPPRVTIEVRGGELFIYSNDGVALEQVEQTIRDLVKQMPSRTEWTVFYLRAAAANEIAQSLVDLLRTDPYSSTALGVGIDRSVIGNQTMRIIPDARTNALFVSGPEKKVEQAAEFLKLLDSTELPESMRDRVPRAIEVKYADVNAVADMVRELFKDFMEDPNARRQDSRGNDRNREEERQQLVSAAASQTPGLRPPGIRLTLAVDEAANTLLVSCNEHVFEQIRQLVEDRDKAALDSRPTMQVVPVNNFSSGQLGTLLQGMSPQITVSPAPRPNYEIRGRSENSRSNGFSREQSRERESSRDSNSRERD